LKSWQHKGERAEEFLAATGLTAEELAHIEDKHLLMPLENNVYNDDDLMAANAPGI
jgi:hypothetical protein